jgi:hypothetical protein
MKKKQVKRKAIKKKTSTSKVAQISKHAKKTRKKGEKWTTAIKHAAKELKGK